MLTGGIADVGRVRVGGVGADIDNSARRGLACQVAPQVLPHQQGIGASVDGEVRVDLSC